MDQSIGAWKAVVLGASGAVGRDLVSELCASSKWSEISVIVRRSLPQWDTLPGCQKIKLVKVDNLDELEETAKWTQFKQYNSFFCCLGSRTKYGDAEFTKVDYSYCLWGGRIAIQNRIIDLYNKEIPHYALVSSAGADKTSMFLYMRVKGQIEDDLGKLGFRYLSVHRPGLIMNRDNDSRIGETIFKYTPFMPKIEVKDLAKAIRINAEQVQLSDGSEPKVAFYTNEQLKQIVTNTP